MNYTIFALEKIDDQTITDFVSADNPVEAMRIFAMTRASAESTIIVDVIEGEHKSAIPDIPATYCDTFLEEDK